MANRSAEVKPQKKRASDRANDESRASKIKPPKEEARGRRAGAIGAEVRREESGDRNYRAK